MTAIYYDQLALGWSPESKSDRQFKIITTAAVVVMLVLGFLLSSINVPQEDRMARKPIPERIANFVLDKKKPKPKPPEVKPKPKPKPKPTPNRVKKDLKKPSERQKPLTKEQKKARDKAAESGLLALSGELSDLMDTSDLSKQVGGGVNSNAGSAKAAGHNQALLSDNVAQGSGGVDEGKYTTKVKQGKLGQRQITQVSQALVSPGANGSSEGVAGGSSSSGGSIRTEESITVVFDQYKSRLYSIYNRERRKSPGLKGKIVLEITISASGKVTSVKVVSSELNSSSLEQRLVRRIKMFDFGPQDVDSVTVTYPIEFLPS